MLISSLREFIEFVPVCVQTEPLKQVLGLLGHYNAAQVVVVDQQSHPLGTVSLRRLLPYLNFSLDDQHNQLSGAPAISFSGSQGLHFHSYQPDLTQAIEHQRWLLEPVTCLSVEEPLPQLCERLPDLLGGHWLAVDADGAYVGWLNQTQLWRSLALSTLRQPDDSLPYSAIAPVYRSRQADSNPPHGEQLPLLLTPLAELLEQLPFPLMLQTHTGQVVLQNGAWQQQAQTFQNLGEVSQEVATILENPAPGLVPVEEVIRQFSTEQGMGSSQASFCHEGIDANTCVCICPMKDGQERVWQFLKIPLSTLIGVSSSSHRVNGPPALVVPATVDAATTSSQFQLAALETVRSEQHLDDIGSVFASESLWLVLAQDMTEQQQVAKELVTRNADLVQTNRLKDEFLATISHELKAPLTSVLSLSSLLKNQILGELNERQMRYVQLIHQSSRHLALLVNDILDLTRLETGQLKLNLAPVEIQSVCDRAFAQAQQMYPLGATSEQGDLVQPQLPEFTFDLQPGLSHLVADDLRLCQMLANLLANAMRFTRPDGQFGLQVETWEHWIAFTVWNSGFGIPAEQHPHVFQQFQHLESPVTEQFEGTGLGLVLTKRLAQLHGGEVTFTSVESQGSRFTILLPPQLPTTDATPALSSEQVSLSQQGDRLILVVEANPLALNDLTNQLMALGYRVAIARSGPEALEKARRLQPAAILLNPMLPLLSGWDVLTLLKSDRMVCQIPVIVLAPSTEQRQPHPGDADGFLSLPIQTEDLCQSLIRLIAPSPNASASDCHLNLTILHLNPVLPPDANLQANPQLNTSSLNNLLHPYHCRVLEVDDLEQAALLARVWHPDLVLLNGSIPDPPAYLHELSQHESLSMCPLVTLTPEITQAANKVSGLSVFPCLAPLSTAGSSMLIQVIQIAARHHAHSGKSPKRL